MKKNLFPAGLLVFALMLTCLFGCGGSGGSDSGQTGFPDDYIARWRLNNNLNDELGNYDLSVVTGTISYDDTNYLEGDYSGQFDEATTLTSGAFSFGDNTFSVSMWVYLDATATGDDPQVIKWGNYDLCINPNTSASDVNINYYVGNTSYDTDDPGLAEDTWIHLVLTYDGSTVSFYTNNIKYTDTPAVAPDVSGVSEPILIGSGDAECFLKGNIDDVILYDRALSDAEVSAIYND